MCHARHVGIHEQKYGRDDSGQARFRQIRSNGDERYIDVSASGEADDPGVDVGGIAPKMRRPPKCRRKTF
jgi:hypothetical protein